MYNVSIANTVWNVMKPNIVQFNIKITESDLAKIDAKAKRYGLNRSAMLKLFGLNAEMNFSGLDKLKKPKV